MSPARIPIPWLRHPADTASRRLMGDARNLMRGVSGCALAAVATPAVAMSGELAASFDPRSAFGSSVIVGVVIFATVLSILHLRERRTWAETERALREEVARLRGADDRAGLLLGSECQVVIAWSGPAGSEPSLEGDPTLAAPGANYRRVLAFGSWLAPADAGRLEAALTVLRERGETFRLTLQRAAGGYVEAEGRTLAGRALLRLRDVSGDRSDVLRVNEEARVASDSLGAFRGLLDAIDEPVWLRGPGGALCWANRAYCSAVEAASVDAVTGRSLELLDRRERDAAAMRRHDGHIFRSRVAAIVAGSRRVLDITEAPLAGAEAFTAGGIARDVSDLEAIRGEIGLQGQAHVRMLDQLATAVAMFDAGQRLVFHNAAYRQLWDPRAGVPRQPADGRRDPRPSAGRPPSPRAGGLPDLEGRAPKRLPHDGAGRDLVAPAGSAHAAGGHQSGPAGRAHLPVRRCLRPHAPRIALQCADPHPGGDAGRARGGRRPVRPGRAPEAVQSRLRRAVALRPRGAGRIAPYRRRRGSRPRSGAPRSALGGDQGSRFRPVRPARERQRQDGAARWVPPGLRSRAAPGRGDAPDVRRRDRDGERRAGPHGAPTMRWRAPAGYATSSCITSPTSCDRP